MANKFSKRNIKLIGVASVGLLGVAGFFLVMSPLINQQGIQATERTDAEAKIITLQDQLTGVATVENNYPEVKVINDKLASQFPSLATVPTLLNAISLAASQSGISPESISTLAFTTPALVESAAPAAPAAGSGDAPQEGALDAAGEKAVTDTAGSAPGQTTTSDKLASMDLTLSVSGNPRQFEAFLNNLAGMDRVIIVTGASISGASADSPKGGTLALQAKTYLYERILSPDERKADGTAPATGVPADGTLPADGTVPTDSSPTSPVTDPNVAP